MSFLTCLYNIRQPDQNTCHLQRLRNLQDYLDHERGAREILRMACGFGRNESLEEIERRPPNSCSTDERMFHEVSIYGYYDTLEKILNWMVSDVMDNIKNI